MLYRLFANTIGPPLALAAGLGGRFGGRWRERLSLYDAPPPPAGTRLWFHAASVGEAASAAIVIRAVLELAPSAEIWLSVGTPAGLTTAESIFANEARVRVVAAPLDFWGAPARAFKKTRPAAIIIWETELWPDFIRAAKKSGASLILAAARLTERSFRRYSKISGFMADLLSNFDLIAASGEKERAYYAALKAPADRLTVLGNPKFDALTAGADSAEFKNKVENWRQALGPDSKVMGLSSPFPAAMVESPLICGGALPLRGLVTCGSTHRGEEELLLKFVTPLLARRPQLRLLLAPRHLTRIDEVAALVKKAGLSPAIIDGPQSPPPPGARVLLLNCMGQLSALYALSAAVVVGGSFIEGLAGHNPLEPAALARPIIFGPHMASFQSEADGLVQAGGALRVRPWDLAPALEKILDGESSVAQALGLSARRFLETRPPAAPALAAAILAKT